MTDQIITRCQRCDRFHHASEPCRLKWGRRGFLSMIGIAPFAMTRIAALQEPIYHLWYVTRDNSRLRVLHSLSESQMQAFAKAVHWNSFSKRHDCFQVTAREGSLVSAVSFRSTP